MSKARLDRHGSAFRTGPFYNTTLSGTLQTAHTKSHTPKTMADEDDEMRDEKPPESGDESGSSSDNDSDSSEEVVPLVAGREKRATAGNRMNTLLEAAAEEEDEVTLLFAEDEEDEDVEFEGDDDEAGSDAQFDSSSDDDDQGPNAAVDDDLEGEQELQRKEKAERTRKRKANDALTTSAGVRKKARFDPAVTAKRLAAPPKPSKKKERESWSLSDNIGPSRTSLRPQTAANTEVTRVRVKQADALHAKVVERLKKKRQEREKDMPGEMTQAERLAEAEKVEKKNAKSLNRWETMEKKRAEEQAAKLAALHERKLEGPVVSWWSGVAKWLGPKLTRVGSIETTQEPVVEGKKRGRKPKSYYDSLEVGKEGEGENSSIGTPRDQTSTPAPSEAAVNSGTTTEATAVTPAEPAPAPQITFAAPQGPDNFLHGIHEYASLPPEAAASTAPPPILQPAPVTPLYSSVVAHSLIRPASPSMPSQSVGPPILALPPPPPPIPEDSTRNLVILSKFDELPAKHRNEYAFFNNNRKTPKPPKQAQELCAITSLPARYRDPATGLAYANSLAYKKLQEIKKHNFTWSSMLGCYVGAAGVAARGVPEGFLGT